MVSYHSCQYDDGTTSSVLILVVVDDGLILEEGYKDCRAFALHVLILVVVDDGLVQKN